MNKKDAISIIESMIADTLSIKASSGGFWARTQERRFARRIEAIFKKQMAYVVDRLKGFEWIQKGYFEDMDSLLADMPEKEALVDYLVQYIRLAYRRGFSDRVDEFDLAEFGVSFDLVAWDAQKILSGRRTFELSNFAGTISATTNRKIVKIVEEGFRTRKTYNEIAGEIMKQGRNGVFSFARARLIATTEIGRAYGAGSMRAIDSFTSKTGRKAEKMWITAADEKVRKTHVDNALQGWIDSHARFVGTGDAQAPSTIDFNCRCTLGFKII